MSTFSLQKNRTWNQTERFEAQKGWVNDIQPVKEIRGRVVLTSEDSR